MDRSQILTQAEWQVMDLLWQQPHTLMELVTALEESIGWSKSTVATMVRRMEAKGIITHDTSDRARVYRPALKKTDAALRETRSLLDRAYQGSIGLLVSNLASEKGLTRQDIDELYEILRHAQEVVK